MTISKWTAYSALVGLGVVIACAIGYYIYGRILSDSEKSISRCYHNACVNGSDFISFIFGVLTCLGGTVFLLMGFLLSYGLGGSIQPNNVTLGNLMRSNSDYCYIEGYNVRKITNDKVVAYIDKEFSDSTYNYYDKLNITYKYVNLSFSEFLQSMYNYYNKLNIPYEYVNLSFSEFLQSIDYSSTSIEVDNIDVERNTKSFKVQGVLKTEIVNSSTAYKIGEYTLIGDDNNGKISSLLNGTEVNLEIEYDSSYNDISYYRILNASEV